MSIATERLRACAGIAGPASEALTVHRLSGVAGSAVPRDAGEQGVS